MSTKARDREQSAEGHEAKVPTRSLCGGTSQLGQSSALSALLASDTKRGCRPGLAWAPRRNRPRAVRRPYPPSGRACDRGDKWGMAEKDFVKAESPGDDHSGRLGHSS
jgi:hypothetical protein